MTERHSHRSTDRGAGPTPSLRLAERLILGRPARGVPGRARCVTWLGSTDVALAYEVQKRAERRRGRLQVLG